MSPKSRRVECHECENLAVLVTGADVYPHRSDLHHKSFWKCACGAYVGCHPGTTIPLGSPCGPTTRTMRAKAHAAFDPLWKTKADRDGVSKTKARGAGYKWLAGELGIEPSACHIGMMDVHTAHRVVVICEGVLRHATRAQPTLGSSASC